MNKLKVRSIIMIAVLVVGGGIIAYTVKGGSEEDKHKEMIQADVESYLTSYQVEAEYVPAMNYLAGKIAPVAAESAMQVLKNPNASAEDVISSFENEIAYAVSDTNRVNDLRLSQQQLNTVSSGIEAICVSDIYKILSEKNFGTTTVNQTDKETLNNLQNYVESKLLSMESYIVTQENELTGKMAALEGKVASINTASAKDVLKLQNDLNNLQGRVQTVENTDSNGKTYSSLDDTYKQENDRALSDMTEIINQIRQVDDSIANDLEQSLKALDENGDYSDFQRAINTAISKLVEKTLANDNDIKANSDSIVALANDINKNKSLAKADINNLKLVVDKVNSDMYETLKKNQEANEAAIRDNKKAISDTNKSITDAKSDIDSNKKAMDKALLDQKTDTQNAISGVNSKIDENKNASDAALQQTKDELSQSIADANTKIGENTSAIINNLNQINSNMTQMEADITTNMDTKLTHLQGTINNEIAPQIKSVKDEIASQKTDFDGRIKDLEDDIDDTGYMIGRYSTRDGQPVLTLTGGKAE